MAIVTNNDLRTHNTMAIVTNNDLRTHNTMAIVTTIYGHTTQWPCDKQRLLTHNTMD